MDDKVKEKLRCVLDVLVKPFTNIKDDTCLNKLIDFLQTNLQKPEDVEICCFPDFLKCVTEKKTTTAVFVFGVHLAGILATKPSLNALYEVKVVRVLQTALSHDLIVEPSVGEALYTVLESVPTTIIDSLTDLLSTTWKILHQKGSLFLTKSAAKFVISYYRKHSNDFESKSAEDLSVFLDKICNHVYRMSSLQDAECQRNPTFLSVCCDILSDLMAIESWNDWIARKFPDFNIIILKILEVADKSVFDPCLQCLLTSAHSKRSEKHFVNELGIKMMNSVDNLVKKDVIKAQAVCYGMMNSGLWSEHYDWMKMMISLPLYLVSMDTEQEKKQVIVQNVKVQMTSRTKAVKILCGTLEKIATLKLMDQHVQEMVMKIFEMTTDDGSCSQFLDIQSYVQDNHKIQQKCLQLINQDFSIWLPYSDKIFAVVIKICQNSRVDNVTYTKSLDCTRLFLPHIIQQRSNTDNNSNNELSNMVFIIQKHLCGMSWEVREATLAFIQKVVTSYKDESPVMSWFKDNRLDVSVWQCLSDSESYVRSSSIDCLTDIILCHTIRDHLQSCIAIDFNGMIARIEDMCRNDTEAFVRRSAVLFFTKLWEDNSLSETSKQAILTLFSEVVVKDFDWDVKLNVLEFWSQIIDKEFCTKEKLDFGIPSYAMVNNESIICSDTSVKDHLKMSFCKLYTLGCFKALFSMVEDFDQSVVEKALLLIRNIKDIVKRTNFTSEFANFLDEFKIVKDSLKDNEVLCKKQKLELKEIEKTNFSIEIGQKEEILEFIEKLMTLDVEQKLTVFSQTCDEYDRNPVSLLDDILLYAGSHDHQDEDDSTIIDCY